MQTQINKSNRGRKTIIERGSWVRAPGSGALARMFFSHGRPPLLWP